MERNKLLVSSTLAAFLCLFAVAVGYQFFQKPAPLVVSRVGTLTIGKPSAEVEIVLIEDFKCRKCRNFSQKIIPKIEQAYINTGKARFTIIPISFLAGSQAISNAALEVYAQKPEQLFPYLKAVLYLQGEVRKEELVLLAKKLEGIHLDKLNDCIEKGCHNQALEQNLNWARNLMGLQFRTPALYINGAPGSTFSFEAIQYQIEQLKKTK